MTASLVVYLHWEHLYRFAFWLVGVGTLLLGWTLETWMATAVRLVNSMRQWGHLNAVLRMGDVVGFLSMGWALMMCWWSLGYLPVVVKVHRGQLSFRWLLVWAVVVMLLFSPWGGFSGVVLQWTLEYQTFLGCSVLMWVTAR